MLLDSEKSQNRNRSKMDIVQDMLSVASARTRKTRIMYQANLSFVQVERYLKELLGGGLVERNEGALYLTTPKGHEFLKNYANYLEHSSRVNRELDEVVKERRKLEDIFLNDKSHEG